MTNSTFDKLAILSDAAKYDASCASSGTTRRDSRGGKGIGSSGGAGICHAYTPDGRCISLLKVLLTNFCVFDCRYCINRASSNTPRARFRPEELVDLTLSFYKRNYIEGLFLSSGIIQSPDYTMEQMLRVVRSLRVDHGFRGYIHLKTIAEASAELIQEAGRLADRLSVNIELPTEAGLSQLAPEKTGRTIRKTMAEVKLGIDEREDATRNARRTRAPRFAPAGQSTQMIVGADQATDTDVLATASRLYAGYGMRRVYYSAYSPIPDASSALPPAPPPLMREHRLYQADWMTRYYGYSVDDISSATDHGMLDLGIDPKLAYALRHRDQFPVDINLAPRELLLRVPGLGPRNVDRIISSRKHGRIDLSGLARMRAPLAKVRPFIIAQGWSPGSSTDSANLKSRFEPAPQQLSLF